MDEEQSRRGDSLAEGVYLYGPDSSPLPPSTRDIDRWNHHISLQQFGKELEAATKAVFPNKRESRYSRVFVLILSWEDEDPQLPVSIEIEKLYEVFSNVYRFETEHWKIPARNSHYRLNEKIMGFVVPDDESRRHLKIVYYAGHARLMDTRTLAWTSFRNNKTYECPFVKWSGIQNVLGEASSDVLILLDCCASGIANTCEGNGVNEVLSACAYNAIANGVGPYSFTYALVIELRRLSKKSFFSTGELYRNIFIRTQIRPPEEIPEENKEIERHPAPIHLVLTQDRQGPRSIILSVRETEGGNDNRKSPRKQDDPGTAPKHERIGAQKDGIGISEDAQTQCNLSSRSELSSGGEEFPTEAEVFPRLAFAVRLRDTFTPNADLRDQFLEWLRSMPTIAEEVRVEAGFDSFSTLLIVSVPISVSGYLSYNPAVIPLGPVTSSNRLSDAGDTKSLISFLDWGMKMTASSVLNVDPKGDIDMQDDMFMRYNVSARNNNAMKDDITIKEDVTMKEEVVMTDDLALNNMNMKPRGGALSSADDFEVESGHSWTTAASSRGEDFRFSPEENTAPLDISFLETVVYHDRIYQQYSINNLVYLQPIDEDEQERLLLLHRMLSMVFDNRLLFPPLTRPRRILECGYGTGTWAIAVAEENPGCEVIGIDINPMMAPEELPHNLFLQVDDLNRRFTFPAHNFDLVHSQMVVSGLHVNRWTQYLRDIFRVTRGGGWCQMTEIYYNIQSHNGSLTQDNALCQWSSKYLQSLEGIADLRAPVRLADELRAAGFVDVESRMIQLHTCAWSTEQRDIEIGTANRENVQRLLYSLAVYPFTERLGMTIQETHLLVAQARLEAGNPAFKAYFPLYICIGRKPRR